MDNESPPLVVMFRYLALHDYKFPVNAVYMVHFVKEVGLIYTTIKTWSWSSAQCRSETDWYLNHAGLHAGENQTLANNQCL